MSRPPYSANAFHLVWRPVAIHTNGAHACEKTPTKKSTLIKRKRAGKINGKECWLSDGGYRWFSRWIRSYHGIASAFAGEKWDGVRDRATPRSASCQQTGELVRQSDRHAGDRDRKDNQTRAKHGLCTAA